MIRTSRKKKKNKIDGSFAVLEENLVNSKAFEGLSVYTKWLYMEFKRRFRGDNARRIILTKEEATKIMAYKTFRESRDKLIERGIIDLIHTGGLEKQPAIYGLSNRWEKYGTKDFIKVELKDIWYKEVKTGFKKGNKYGRQFKKKASNIG